MANVGGFPNGRRCRGDNPLVVVPILEGGNSGPGPGRPRRRGGGSCSLEVVNLGSEYDDDTREFLVAMDRYRRRSGRRFPNCAEVLAVAKSLGWRKVIT